MQHTLNVSATAYVNPRKDKLTQARILAENGERMFRLDMARTTGQPAF